MYLLYPFISYRKLEKLADIGIIICIDEQYLQSITDQISFCNTLRAQCVLTAHIITPIHQFIIAGATPALWDAASADLHATFVMSE